MKALKRGLLALMCCLMLPVAARAENHRGMLEEESIRLGVTLEAVPMNALPVYALAEDLIVPLARMHADDPVLGPVLAFHAAQSDACWGRMVSLFPSVMADEESPFHLCTHGTLAAVKAMMDRLQAVAPGEPDVAYMNARVTRDLLKAGAAQLCVNSRPVDTWRDVSPTVGEVASYYLRVPAVQAQLGIILLAMFIYLGVAVVDHRRRQRQMA